MLKVFENLLHRLFIGFYSYLIRQVACLGSYKFVHSFRSTRKTEVAVLIGHLGASFFLYLIHDHLCSFYRVIGPGIIDEPAYLYAFLYKLIYIIISLASGPVGHEVAIFVFFVYDISEVIAVGIDREAEVFRG